MNRDHAGGYGFAVIGYNSVVSKDRTMVVLCRIRALYEKEGGKSGRHNSVASSSNIGAISYIVVQTYRLWMGNLFQSTSVKFPQCQTATFAQLKSVEFLCTLKDTPDTQAGSLRLEGDDWETYRKLVGSINVISVAQTKLRKRTRV